MYKNGMTCPACSKGKLKAHKKDLEFAYKKTTTTFQGERIYACDVCPEEFLSRAQSRAIEKKLTDFRRSIDGLLTSEEIKAIRLSLGLTQVQMANLLGVGKKNFARYENGQVTQSKPMDHLLRVIKELPLSLTVIAPSFWKIKESHSSAFVRSLKFEKVETQSLFKKKYDNVCNFGMNISSDYEQKESYDMELNPANFMLNFVCHWSPDK